MEYNDIYDAQRRPVGRVHLRGTPWQEGEYGLAVFVWVYDGHGRLLLTRRAPEKTAAGTWENTGGAAKAGEYSRQAIARELFEETGIRAEEGEFLLLDSECSENMHHDHYALRRETPLRAIVLLPGETVDARWLTFSEVHDLIARGEICDVIAAQFLRLETRLRALDGKAQDCRAE